MLGWFRSLPHTCPSNALAVRQHDVLGQKEVAMNRVRTCLAVAFSLGLAVPPVHAQWLEQVSSQIHEFGDPDIDQWTTLQTDRVAWVETRNKEG